MGYKTAASCSKKLTDQYSWMCLEFVIALVSLIRLYFDLSNHDLFAWLDCLPFTPKITGLTLRKDFSTCSEPHPDETRVQVDALQKSLGFFWALWFPPATGAGRAIIGGGKYSYIYVHSI